MESTPDLALRESVYDFSSSDALARELQDLRGGKVVIDCANVEHIDSSAITVLIRFFKRMCAEDADSELHLANVRPTVRRLMEITGLTNLFTIH